MQDYKLKRIRMRVLNDFGIGWDRLKDVDLVPRMGLEPTLSRTTTSR